MVINEEAIGYGQIELITPYEIQTLQNVTLIQTVNDHTKLFLTGIIPEEKKDSYLAMASSSDTITLNQINERGSFVHCLFQGRLIDITIRSVRGIYYIELEAISHTYSMDLERKTRSFQNKNMTYVQMIQSILKSYPKSDFIDNATNDSKLGKFVLQYQETDWQFLKRMASHFGAVLVPDSTAEAPKFWLGMQVGKKQRLSEHQYRVKKDLSFYLDTIENSAAPTLQENDFLTYVIESKQSLSLGDLVTIKGQEMMVFQSIATMKQGTLTYEYLLSRKEGIRKSLFYNETLKGAALQGKVIDIAKDTVRIHLDIDPEQKKDEAIWFPYSTVYSAEGHTGFYSMPQLGDTVQLYFPNRNEVNAITVNSIRQGGDTNPKTADPSTKLWGTASGKEMKMNGSEMSFTAKEGEVHLKLDIKEGIEFQSKPPIVFQSGNIDIHAGNTVEMKATNAIHLLCATSSIVMDGITDIQGSIVSIEGYNKAPVQVKDSDEEDAPAKQEQTDKFTDPTGPAQNLAGLLPIIGGGRIG